MRSIGQARASTTMTLMAACYNLKRQASFLDRKVDAQSQAIKDAGASEDRLRCKDEAPKGLKLRKFNQISGSAWLKPSIPS